MNDFDIGVMRKIQELHRVQGKYLTQIVVPDAYVKHMARRTFFFYEPADHPTIDRVDIHSALTHSRVQVDVVSESEYAVEKRQRERVHSPLNLWDF